MLLTALPGWGATVLQTTFLTSTSGANQTYNVPATFVSNVSVEVVSSGGAGADESLDGCGNGVGNQHSGGTGGYAIKSGISMTPGGTMTYRLREAGAGSGAAAACWFGGTSLAGSSVGIECGTSGVTGGGDGAGASTTGAKGDTVTGGSTTGHDAGPGAPPAAAQTARSGSGVTTAGDGGGTSGGTGLGGGQGIIKIINLVTA